MAGSVRRIVTGHDSDGKSTIAIDDRPEGISGPGRTAFEIWATQSVCDASNGRPPTDPPELGSGAGTTIRVVDMPAGSVREMHRTRTVDYVLLISGELVLILERGETVLKAGDVVVQRGTLHAWHNRSQNTARIAFINMTGQSAEMADMP